MPFFVSNDDYQGFQADSWAQGAQGKVADQWAASAVADAPDRAAAAEQAAAQQQADQQRQQAAAQAQAAAEAQRQADEQARQQADAAAAAQAQQQQANTWAANQWAAKSYDQAATAATGVAPAPAPPPAPAPQPAPQVDVNGDATQTAAAVGPSTSLPSANSGNYVAVAWDAALRNNLDPNIFVRQLNQESGFRPFNADGSPLRSPAGAIGIGQFMPATARGLGLDPTDPIASIEAAAKMMAGFVQQFGGDMGKALAAYNAGPGAVQKYGGIPPYAETQSYVKTILGDAAGVGAQLAQRAKEGLGAAGQAVGGAAQTAANYVFPVQGYSGDVALHWGDVPGGSDLFAPRGTPVLAMRGGKVVEAGYNSIGGNSVLIQGDDGNQYYYAHFNEAPSVKVGQTVGTGTYLGPVGNTGDAANTGTHLHIGIGPSILLGADKFGGTGGNFDAVGLLRRVLTGQGAQQATGAAAGPGAMAVPAGPGAAPGQPAQPQAQTMAQFIQQYQSTQGRMPTDTELGNFVLSQPPEQTAASVGTPQPIQQPTSPFDVVGNIASGLGGAVSGAVSGVTGALGGLFGRGGPGGQSPGGPTETAPAATASPFPGLPQLPTGMPPEGGGYGVGGPLLPGEAASAFAPVGQAVTGLASSPLLPTNLTNAGLQAVGQNVVAPGLEALAQPGGPLIGPRTAAAQALEGLAGQVPAGVPVVGGLLERAAGIVGGPTIIDAAQTATQLEQKYGGGLQTTPDGRVVWRPPDYSRITPEDQNALSNAMMAVGGVTQLPGPEAGGTAAERAALSTQEGNFLRSSTLVPTGDPRPLGPSQPGLPNVKAVMQQNLAEVLPADAVLYHETSLPNARAILQRVEAGPRNQSGIWTSDNRDLALGQGGKGVMLEFDPSLVNGGAGENPAKAFSAQAGIGTEYQLDKTLRGAVQAIVVNTQQQADQLAADPLIANRFDFLAAQQTSEGIRIPYAGPSRAPVAPAEVPSATPVNVGESTTAAGTSAVSPPEIARAGEPVAATAPASTTAGIAPPRAVADLPTAAPVSGTAGGNLPVEQIPEVQAAAAGGAGEPPIRPPTAVGAPPPMEPEPGLLNRLTQGQPEQAGNITLSKYPEDVRQVITDAASSLPDQMKAATRGVLPDQAVRDLSQQTGIDVDQIVRNWNPGQAQNAETLLALRDALTAQVRKVIDAQQTLRATPDSVTARGDLLEALTQHAAIQEVVSGSTAEAGRALRQFRQAAPGSDFATNQISQMAARSGMTPEEMVDALGRVDLSDPIATAQLARALPVRGVSPWDFIRALRVGSLAGGIPTISHIAINVPVQAGLRLLSDVPSIVGRAVIGRGTLAEIPAEFTGMWKGLEVWADNAAQTLGQPGRLAQGMGGGAGAQAVETGLLGLVKTHPVIQDMARQLGTNMELWRSAAQQASEGGLRAGTAAWQTEVQRLIANPTPEMVQNSTRIGDRFALGGPLGTQGQKLADYLKGNPIGQFILPFFNIGYHVGAQGAELLPFTGIPGTAWDVIRAAAGKGPYAGAEGFAGTGARGAVTPLAERVRNNLIGLGLSTWAFSHAAEGLITGNGPNDPSKKQELVDQGWMPDAFKIGDRYFDAHVLGPVGWALVGGANAYEATHGPEEGGYAKPGTSAWDTFTDYLSREGQYFENETFLKSLGQVLQVIGSTKDAGRVGEQELASVLQSLVPQGALLGNIASAMDPFSRKPQLGDYGQALEQRIPGLRQTLPERLTRAGEPVPNPQAGPAILLPRSTQIRPDPMLQLLGASGVALGPAPKTITVANGRQVQLTPEEQQTYLERRGDLLQQMTASLQTNAQFLQAPPQARRQVLDRLVSQAGTVAGRQVIAGIGSGLGSRIQTTAELRPVEPLPALRPPLPLNELQPAASTTAPSRAQLPLTSDLATLDPLQQEQMRRQLAGTP